MSYSHGDILDAIERVTEAMGQLSKSTLAAHKAGLKYQRDKDAVKAALDNLDRVRGKQFLTLPGRSWK